jgi:hypothetical protein
MVSGTLRLLLRPIAPRLIEFVQAFENVLAVQVVEQTPGSGFLRSL